MLERAKALSAEVKEAEVAQAAADAGLRAAQLAVSNVVGGRTARWRGRLPAAA